MTTSIRYRRPAIAILAFGSAAIIARMIADGTTRGFDQRCRRRALRRRTKVVKRVAKVFSTVGEPAAQLSLAVLATLDLARTSHGRRQLSSDRNLGTLSAAAAPMFSALAGIAAHRSIKLVFKRRRPPDALKTEPSFPSGHTSVTTATAFTIALAARARGARSAYVVPTALLLSACVGVSRVFLDEHWATDVIGGWCIGTGIASGTTALVSSFAASPARPKSPPRTRAKIRDGYPAQ